MTESPVHLVKAVKVNLEIPRRLTHPHFHVREKETSGLLVTWGLDTQHESRLRFPGASWQAPALLSRARPHCRMITVPDSTQPGRWEQKAVCPWYSELLHQPPQSSGETWSISSWGLWRTFTADVLYAVENEWRPTIIIRSLLATAFFKIFNYCSVFQVKWRINSNF